MIPTMDRYIPSNSSMATYHALPNTVTKHKSLPNILYCSIDEEGFTSNLANYPRTNSPQRQTSTAHGRIHASDIAQHADPNDTSFSSSSNKASKDSYDGIIARALGFSAQKRVLTFHPSKTGSKPTKLPKSSTLQQKSSSKFYDDDISDSSMETVGPLLSSMSPQLAAIYLANIPGKNGNEHKPEKKKIKAQIPYKVLDAPGLKNDFYSNLISWSKKTGKVSVGLGSHVYLWSEESGAVPLPLSDYNTISALAFSDYDFLVVGTKSGKIMLYSQEQRCLLGEIVNYGKGICCIAWMPDSNSAFFVGNEVGEVLYYEIDESDEAFEIKLSSTFKSHEQQVCGIAISNNKKQIAVGGNDNCCTIWNIDDLYDPKLKYSSPHQAAVKAIAYCPWSNSLLATGGGSKDRTIRFWHTNSGTLLDSRNTKGQITSLIWSRSKKQIVATFGFGDTTKPLLISVYSYPQLQPLMQVPAAPNLRILSAIVSPDFKSVCVATNDETVRFYELWSTKAGLVGEAQEGGVFGSDLIELCEGIVKCGDVIR